mgnify:CR=1 FL=1
MFSSKSFGQHYRSSFDDKEELRQAPQEFDTEIVEAPISQPYDFINMVATSKDKKLVDFKKGNTKFI